VNPHANIGRKGWRLAVALGIPAAGPALAAPAVHAVVDLAHEVSFYADGRFARQYLDGQKDVTSWGALRRFDFANANLLVLLDCAEPLRYTPADLEVIGPSCAMARVAIFVGRRPRPQHDLAKRSRRIRAGCTGPVRLAPDSRAGCRGHSASATIRPGRRTGPRGRDADGRPLRRCGWWTRAVIVSPVRLRAAGGRGDPINARAGAAARSPRRGTRDRSGAAHPGRGLVPATMSRSSTA
jgi:hypothetical protein